MLWISCRDALRLSLLHSRCKLTSVQMKSFHRRPPLCVVNHLCVSVSPWALIAMPGCLRSPDSLSLCSPSVSAESNLPSSTSFSLMRVEILLWLLKQSQQTPHPPPQSPYHSCASCYTLPSLCCCCLSSLFSLLSTQKHMQTCRKLSVRCPVAAPEGLTCISDAPQSQALQLETQTLTSPRNRSSAKRPPLGVICSASWIVCMRPKQRGKKKRGEQRLAKRQKMMVESRGQKCGGGSSHWGKSSTPCWA